MAGRFAEICRENIGTESGTNRPNHWPELSPRYSKRVGRKEATLFFRGELFNAIQIETGNSEFASVLIDPSSPAAQYASAHQDGNPTGNLPRRAFFPMDENGDLTEYAKAECVEVAQTTLNRILEQNAR